MEEIFTMSVFHTGSMRRHAGTAIALAFSACLQLAAHSAQAQSTGTAAAALQINGVSYAPSLQAQGKTLTLNGAGTRYKAIFKVYTAGLYLEKP
ncbi:MAG: chalcone isomerase family protein, partial [Comamonas sp.]